MPGPNPGPIPFGAPGGGFLQPSTVPGVPSPLGPYTSAYALAVAADGPWAWWRLDEPSGTVIADQVNRHHLKVNGSPTLNQTGIPGETNAAILFTTGSVSADPPFTGGFPTTQISMEAWFKGTAFGASAGVMGLHAGGSGNGFDIELNGSSDIEVRCNSNVIGHAATGYNDGNWHHVVATYQANSIFNLYFDGVLLSGPFAVQPGGIIYPANPFIVGNTAFGSHANFNGAIDEPAVYNYVLSDAQVLAHYNAGIASAFDPASGFPYNVDDPIAAVIATDDTVQAWAIQPPAVAPTVTNAFAGPVVDEVQTQPVPDDTAQAWAVGPPYGDWSSTFTNDTTSEFWNEDQRALADTTVDPSVQSYAIQPPAVAGFNPATGFPWARFEDERFVASRDAADPDFEVAFGVETIAIDYTYGSWSGTFGNAASSELWNQDQSALDVSVVDPTSQTYAIQPPAAFNPNAGFPWNQDQGERFVDLRLVTDDTAFGYAIQPPVVAVTTVLTGPAVDELQAQPIVDDTPQPWAVQIPPVLSAYAVDGGEVQFQPGIDDSVQSWPVRPPLNAVLAQAFNTPDEAPYDVVDDPTVPTYAIQPPPYIPVFALTAFNGDSETWQQVPGDDPSVQAWAITPPQNADRLTAWNGDEPSLSAGPAVDDTAQSYAIAPVAAAFDPSTVSWTSQADELVTGQLVDDTAQAYTIQPVAAAFDPSTVTWTGRDDIVQPVWAIADDTGQSWAVGPLPMLRAFNEPQLEPIAPAWFIDHMTSTTTTATLGVETTYIGGYPPGGTASTTIAFGTATGPLVGARGTGPTPGGDAVNPKPGG
jgi:hypothetical protein